MVLRGCSMKSSEKIVSVSFTHTVSVYQGSQIWRSLSWRNSGHGFSEIHSTLTWSFMEILRWDDPPQTRRTGKVYSSEHLSKNHWGWASLTSSGCAQERHFWTGQSCWCLALVTGHMQQIVHACCSLRRMSFPPWDRSPFEYERTYFRKSLYTEHVTSLSE